MGRANGMGGYLGVKYSERRRRNIGDVFLFGGSAAIVGVARKIFGRDDAPAALTGEEIRSEEIKGLETQRKEIEGWGQRKRNHRWGNRWKWNQMMGNRAKGKTREANERRGKQRK